ncbi:MAG: glycosyltransferase family 2 protein [Actinomycetota bacterium]
MQQEHADPQPTNAVDVCWSDLIVADTLIFLPVWNQVKELPVVLAEIESAAPQGVDFLLIDNGSSDGSERLMVASGLPVVRVPVNLGIGHAFLIAFEWAREHGYQYFGSMAGNGKMLASEVDRLVAPLRQGTADYVTGSRFLPGGDSPNLPWFRRWAIPMVNFMARVTTGAALTDATNGFRVYRLALLEAAEFDLDASWLRTYGFEYYVYAKALMDSRIRCIEVPGTMRYPPQGRYSKIRPGRDWWAMLWPWIRASLDRARFGPLPWLSTNTLREGRTP